MAAPIVAFYDSTGTNPVTEWNIGDLDANAESSIFKVTLWNNKGGSTAVSSMKRVKMNVVNPQGGDQDLLWDSLTGDLVVDGNGVAIPQSKGPLAENWVHTRINYGGSDDSEGWVPIGGQTYVDIAAGGIDVSQEGYIISGSANSGSVSTDVENFASIDLKMVVPLDAEGGIKHFKERVTYAFT